jgi:hypothetical protein
VDILFGPIDARRLVSTAISKQEGRGDGKEVKGCTRINNQEGFQSGVGNQTESDKKPQSSNEIKTKPDLAPYTRYSVRLSGSCNLFLDWERLFRLLPAQRFLVACWRGLLLSGCANFRGK